MENPNSHKISRKEQILQSLARMLEASPGERITTAALAKEVGVSEAALYRHFPSKARMFEGLIKFIEDTLFQRISRILKEEENAHERCHKILTLLLTFADKNPGMTRLLTGDALAGETERLRERIAQFYDRFEAQLKQVLREAQIRENMKPSISAISWQTCCSPPARVGSCNSCAANSKTLPWNTGTCSGSTSAAICSRLTLLQRLPAATRRRTVPDIFARRANSTAGMGHRPIAGSR